MTRAVLRPVEKVVTAALHEDDTLGGLRRVLPARGVEHLDPLLVLDELGPVTYAPGEAVGADDHPHRGFETVSYLLEGEGEHEDRAGHVGTLGPGDMVWMTAGAGVVHRERPSVRMLREGGRMHGFQLWVNLPRALKRLPPRYQEISARAIPVVRSADGRASARVLAGEALGVRAVAASLTPIDFHHWSLEPGADVTVRLPEDHNVAVYVFDGAMQVSGAGVARGELAVLGAGRAVRLAAGEERAQALVLGGRPLEEPVAWAGPFVMSTRDELVEAYEDYRRGKMSRISPEVVRT